LRTQAPAAAEKDRGPPRKALHSNTEERASVNNDSTDAGILLQEQWAIEGLARETRTAIATVQELFLVEYKKLAVHAHVTSYLPLLACNSVRTILEAGSAEDSHVAVT
jgi:hypothetical protein